MTNREKVEGCSSNYGIENAYLGCGDEEMESVPILKLCKICWQRNLEQENNND